MSNLLFICGFPSGGTDLTKTILNAHPDVYINGEMPFLYQLGKYGITKDSTFSSLEEVESFKKLLRKINTWGNIENLNYDFSQDLEEKKSITQEEILQTCFSGKSRRIWGNKTPQNTEHIAQLNRLFPTSRFLIVVRDVREVCLSWNNKWGRNMNWCADKWAGRMMKGWEECQKLSSSRYLFIKFEEIIQETENINRLISAFIGIPFSERMMEHEKFMEEFIDGKINYGREILSENQEKWRDQMSKEKVKRIEEISFETMNLFNYQPEFASKSVPLKQSEKLYGYFHDSVSILTTGNRASANNKISSRMTDLIFEIRKKTG